MMARQAVGLLLGGLIYGALITGLVLLCLTEFRRIAARWKLRRRLALKKAETRTESRWRRKLRLTLRTALGWPVPVSAAVACLLLLFAAILLAGWRILPISQALIIALIGSTLPCLVLYIRAVAIRLRGSYEGEALITEFLRQYRICDCNVDSALEQLVTGQAAIRRTRQSVYRLLLELRTAGHPEQVKRATDDFALALGTHWGRMLAANLCLGLTQGTHIGQAIEDILIQLREARSLTEERKRLNSESIRMAWFLVPAIYLATVLMAVNYLDLPLGHFLRNQFYTAEGFLFFALIVFLFLFNICLLSFVVNRRFDF
ncbi:MAG TPA: hypothetical protein GX726_05430 [Clostridiales bacterium]|nr:hypothetical protein [Clostridiales bacterium]